MVVMPRLAGDERVLAGRQIQPLDGTELGEELERAEDRGAVHPKVAAARFVEQRLGREMALLLRDQLREGATRRGPAVPGSLQEFDDLPCVDHVVRVSQSRLSRNNGAERRT